MAYLVREQAQDVTDIRKVLGMPGRGIMIFSKIESQEGLENFDEILKVSDGIMVARGDLGIEIPIQNVSSPCLRTPVHVSSMNIVKHDSYRARSYLRSTWLRR